MLPFAEAMLCVPVETACVDRGFSEHRVINHRLTNRLCVVTVDSLMRVSILAGNVESFDYAAAKEFHSKPVGELLVNKLFAAMSKEPANQPCVLDVVTCECDLAMSSRQYCNNEGLDPHYV
ncbi:unnamed protein product [Sphagnum troendelagicum]|uniref:HAT C-terminal dimerisation domain-containing protein n=1 Tax=Sphagnum troendelagicum TaxID=128251 RepID=A0ABP0THY3_9BRYO